jgi:hypothetical protein
VVDFYIEWERLRGLSSLAWSVHFFGLGMATVARLRPRLQDELRSSGQSVGVDYTGLLCTGALGMPASRRDVRVGLTDGGRFKHPRQSDVDEVIDLLVARGLWVENVEAYGRKYMAIPHLVPTGTLGAFAPQLEGQGLSADGADGRGLKGGADDEGRSVGATGGFIGGGVHVGGQVGVVVAGGGDQPITERRASDDSGASGTRVLETRKAGELASAQGQQAGGSVTAEEQQRGSTGAVQERYSGTTGAAEKPPDVEYQGLRAAASGGDLGDVRVVSGNGLIGGLSIYIGCSSVVSPAGPAGRLIEGQEQPSVYLIEGEEGRRALASAGPASPALNRTKQQGPSGGESAGEGWTGARVGEDLRTKGGTEPYGEGDASLYMQGAGDVSAGEAGPADARARRKARLAARAFGKEWVRPGPEVVTDYVEAAMDLTKDFESAKGFRFHIRCLCQRERGEAAVRASLMALHTALASGAEIRAGAGYGNRGWFLTNRLERACKDLGLLPERRRTNG